MIVEVNVALVHVLYISLYFIPKYFLISHTRGIIHVHTGSCHSFLTKAFVRYAGLCTKLQVKQKLGITRTS